MSALPKFNFKNVELDDAALNTMIEESTGKGESKYFRPGKHEVQVVSATYQGQASDDTWAKWLVKFQGAGDKETSDLIFVPTTKLTYRDKKGNENAFAVKRLKEFLEALGAEFSVKTLGDTLSVYFGKEDAIKGLNVAVNMGYPGTHIAYLGKNEDGSKRYGLAYRSGDPMEKSPTFDSFDAAVAYCEEKKIEVKRFIEILKYEPSSTGNKKPDSNW